MIILDAFTIIVLVMAFLGFASRRLLTYLHAFQQEEYDGKRFISWIVLNGVYDKKLSLILLAITPLWFYLPSFVVDLMVLTGCCVMTYLERDPRKDAKKKLAMTDRAGRIYWTAMGLAFLILAALAALAIMSEGLPIFWLAIVQTLPFLLVAAVSILQPFEDSVQKKYWNEAHAKVTELSPTIIGITGSFGKTSVKHILGHILESTAPTLITPGSVNTPMGIARIIREQLDETHKYFIVEMGAYGPGSIERLCRLAPPDHGILTAIGHAHYERFKSLQTVAETKFELGQAVAAKGGKMIVHEGVFKFEAAISTQSESLETYITCGEEATTHVTIKSVEQTLQGLEIKLGRGHESHILNVPLFGLHHADNIAMAYAMACELGIDPTEIETALKKVPQIPHRLEVKKNSIGGVIIDDAYNSNPKGFSAALDLLDYVGFKSRTILITPGMVELGKVHDEVHKQIGGYAATKCDICIAIQPKRIPTFIEGLEAANTSTQVIKMDTFAEAQDWLSKNMTENDVVLLENDLPDVYERVPKL